MAKVLYHGGCSDGFGAAFIAAHFLGLPETDLIPVSYGKPIPYDRLSDDTDIYIVDFSYPRSELIELADYAQKVIVLDHHASAEKELADLDVPNLYVEFDMKRSGARMTYDYLQARHSPQIPYRRLDLLSRYIQDRDLWTWELPDSREVSAYIAAVPKTLDAWGEHLLNVEWDLVIERGRAVQMKISSETATMTRESKWCLGMFRAIDDVAIINICVAAPGSEILGQLAEGRPFAVGWAQGGDGSFYYSLRSRDDGVDVGALAASLRADGTAFAGGGHARAAGFSSMLRPDELFDNCVPARDRIAS